VFYYQLGSGNAQCQRWSAWQVKCKYKISLSKPRRDTRGVEGNLNSFSTSALDEWSTSRRGRFNPRKETWYPLNMRLDGSQDWSGSHAPKDIYSSVRATSDARVYLHTQYSAACNTYIRKTITWHHPPQRISHK
jgi:hypothetical protein